MIVAKKYDLLIEKNIKIYLLYTMLKTKLHPRLYTNKIIVFLISSSLFVKFHLFSLQYLLYSIFSLQYLYIYSELY